MAKQPKSKTSAKKGRKPTPLWWKRLPLEEQMEYLEKHPRSKLKPSVKRAKKLPPEVDKVIDKQTEDIVADLTQAVDKAEKAWPDVVANMDPKEVKTIESQLMEAINEEPVKRAGRKLLGTALGDDDDEDWGVTRSRRIAMGILLATKIGLLTVGAGALIAVNPNYVFLMPMMAKKVWDAIPDGSVQTGLMLYMGHRMMKGMKRSLQEVKDDTSKLKNAVVEAQPTTVAAPAKKAMETGHYSHYTDIIKSLGKIEQEKIQLAAEHISYQTHPLNRLAASLFLLYKVENMLPNLSNLQMTCSTNEHTALKPRIQKNILDFKAIRGKLKTDIETLAITIGSEEVAKFGRKLFATLTGQIRNVRISQHKSAIFNAADKNKLQMVHCFEFQTRRGYVVLYIHASKLAYAIARSREFTPTFLADVSMSSMMADLRVHLQESM